MNKKKPTLEVYHTLLHEQTKPVLFFYVLLNAFRLHDAEFHFLRNHLCWY